MAFSWFKKKQDAPKGPDFSAIDSAEKARAAYERGELSMIYLFPLDFGGVEGEINRLYVPASVTMLKERFDNMVVDLFEQGLLTSYNAHPEYKGNSFIPSAIVMEAKGKGGITERIEVW
jgi:hypothetical protein